MPNGLSRRRFVLAGSLAASSILPYAQFAFAADAADDLTASRFSREIGAPFTVHTLSSTGGRTATLVLREVRPLSRTAPGLRPEIAQERSFELVFSTEAADLAQDTYEIANPRFGTFVALLVPSRDGKQLSAIFNRMS